MKKITEVTRRDIRELLSDMDWWGRLEEVDFLSRLYDLDQLPSTDLRYPDARSDIIQHRVANYDWENDWVLSDKRFGLMDGEDEILLRFLAETLHPVVITNTETVKQRANLFNELLGPDGYQLVPTGYISGRPIYSAKVIKPATVPDYINTDPTPKHFTKDIKPLLATIARLAELDGSDIEKEVLKNAKARLEEPEYDNLDGGTYYYTLTLTVPVDLFARLGDQVRVVEDRVDKRIGSVLRGPDRHHVTAVVIQPSLLAPTTSQLTNVITARSNRPNPQFWGPGHFRLFISHVTTFKQRATALRQELLKYQISGFVAHETIEPGELWQREIEVALRTMDAMAALITPDFCKSDWTDQEIGWALGLGVYVLPVRRETNPYGFLGEVQGLQGLGKSVPAVAKEVFEILVKQPKTHVRLLEALVTRFEDSYSFQSARRNLQLIECAKSIPSQLLRRIEVAVSSNNQISSSKTVPERVERLVNKNMGA